MADLEKARKMITGFAGVHAFPSGEGRYNLWANVGRVTLIGEDIDQQKEGDLNIAGPEIWTFVQQRGLHFIVFAPDYQEARGQNKEVQAYKVTMHSPDEESWFAEGDKIGLYLIGEITIKDPKRLISVGGNLFKFAQITGGIYDVFAWLGELELVVAEPPEEPAPAETPT